MIIRFGTALVSTLLLGGCAFGSPSAAEPAPEPSRPDPAIALADAWTTVKTYSYRFTTEVSDGRVRMNGSVESGGRDSEVEMTSAAGSTLVRRVQGVNYVRGTPDKTGVPLAWVKVDPAMDPNSIGMLDPSRMNVSIETATEVIWVDDDTVAGTTDAAKTMTLAGADPAVTGKLAGQKFPFEADIDSSGRLVEYRRLPTKGQPDVSTVVTFSAFGTPITIDAPPAAEIQNS